MASEIEDSHAISLPPNDLPSAGSEKLNKMFACCCQILQAFIPCGSFIPACMMKAKGKGGAGDGTLCGNEVQRAKDEKTHFYKLCLVGSWKLSVYLVVFLVLVLSVPKLKAVQVMQLAPLWQWILFAILIVGGNAIGWIICDNLFKSLLKLCCAGNKNALYYIEGLQVSFRFILFSVLLLLSNVLYFANTNLNHHLKKGERYKGIPVYTIYIKYVISTSFAFFIASIFWLVKDFFILQFKAVQVYRRLEKKIQRTSTQLYLIDVIIAAADTSLHPQSETLPNLLKDTDELDKVKWKADCFMSFAERKPSADLLLLEIRGGKIKKLDRHQARDTAIIKPDANDFIIHDSNDLMTLVGYGNDAKLLYDELIKQTSSQPGEVTFTALQKWLVKAHKECSELGKTLNDCLAALRQLGNVLNAVILIITTLLWILMTGNGSTKVLLIIASPFTAGAFMFQEVAKNLIEGIVFTFVRHPFDVGDLCIIEDEELVVKRLGITMTIFKKVGGTGELKLANSTLNTKKIVNLKSIPDAEDQLEFNLDITTSKKQIEDLKKQIEIKLKTKCPKNGERVIVKEVGATIKVIVFFKHGIDTDYDMDHSRFYQTKYDLRSELILDVKEILEKLTIQLAVAPPPQPPSWAHRDIFIS